MLTRVLFALVLICGISAAKSVEAGETKLLAFGVTEHEVTAAELKPGAELPVPRFNTPAMAYVLAANLKKGDVVHIALKNAVRGDTVVRNEATLDSDEAKFLLLAGKRGVPPGGWPKGTYYAEMKIVRDGKPIIAEKTTPIPFE
jgi:hypothetical protein